MIFIFLFASIPSIASGEAVYIRARGQTGQGFAFNFDNKCLTLTSYHVVRDAENQIQLYGISGDIFTADIVGFDEKLDLALLDLKVNGKSGYVHSSSVCQSDASSPGRGPLIESGRMLIKNDKPTRLAWIDRVSAPAGGLDRVFVDGFFGYESYLIRARLQDRSTIFRGDSGAAAWILFASYDERLLRRRLIDNQGNVRSIVRANFLGIVRSISEEGVRLVPPELVNDFIFQVLRPMDWSNVLIEPKNVKVIRRWRGPFNRSALSRSRFINDLGLGSLAFEIDLGDRDFPIIAIDIEYASNPKTQPRGRWSSYSPVTIALGQYRPIGEPAKLISSKRGSYKEVKCKEETTVKLTNSQYRTRCTLLSPRIARSAHLIVTGDPNSIRTIRLVRH